MKKEGFTLRQVPQEIFGDTGGEAKGAVLSASQPATLPRRPRSRWAWEGIGLEKEAQGRTSVNLSPAVAATAAPRSVCHPIKAGLDGGPGRAEGGLRQPAQHLSISSIIQELWFLYWSGCEGSVT